MKSFYRVRRESNRVYILDELLFVQTYGLNKDEYIVFNEEDTSISDLILRKKQTGFTVYLDLTDNEVKFFIEKYRDIPTSDIVRVSLLKKARAKLESIITDVEMLDYVTYIDLNNIFNDKGIFITDDNKEEAYLRILETDDENLINQLEEFLNLRDKLGILKSAKRDYDTVQERIMSTEESDTDSLDDIEKTI